jgi:plasmid stabilization system protein ParE
MRVEYSNRAAVDLRQIASYHARSGNPAVAESIAERIHEVVAPIAASPLSERSVVQKAGRSRRALGELPVQNLRPGGGGHDPDHTHPPHLSAPI